MIFVDRPLDLVLPLSFQKESILDTMRGILPSFDSIDVAIDMSPVCHAPWYAPAVQWTETFQNILAQKVL